MYFITCFRKYEIDERTSVPNIGSARTFGYYKFREDAIEAVRYNYGDIQERIYHYAVVECIPEGLYNTATERIYFKWNEETEQFDEIKFLDDDCGNYAFG